MRARARAGWAAGVAGEGNTAVREVPGRTPTSSTTRGSVGRPQVYWRRVRRRRGGGEEGGEESGEGEALTCPYPQPRAWLKPRPLAWSVEQRQSHYSTVAQCISSCRTELARCCSQRCLTLAHCHTTPASEPTLALPDPDDARASLADDRGVVWRAELAFFQLRLHARRARQGRRRAT